MATISPIPSGSAVNPSNHSSADKVKVEYVFKEGKRYTAEVKTIHHDLSWKVWQGVQAFFLTVFSLGIGFAFQAFRDTWKQKWEQAVTGDEKIFVYTLSPPKGAQTDKTTRLGVSLQPTIELPLEVRNFIQEARKDITKISKTDLEKGLDEALKVAADIKNPDDKTTIYTVAERIAYSYMESFNSTKAFEVRMKVAEAIDPGAPLVDLPIVLQNEHLKLGVKLYPVDTSLFKNQSLGIQKRRFADGKTQLHFNAKLSHPIRHKLQKSIDAIKADPNRLFNALPKGFCKNVKVYDENTTYQGRTDGAKKWEGNFSNKVADGYEVESGGYSKTQVIEIGGIGKIKIGNSSTFRAEYNRISIDLDPNISEADAAESLNIIFAALGLGAAASSSRAEDTERIKVMQLFRAFYPKEAYSFERDKASFDESVESLKARIGNKIPDMKNKFQNYLVDHPEKMYQQEVYPGQPVWCVKGLSADVRKAGGIGLMAGVTANNFDEATSRLMSMLRSGALSTQDRFELGIIAAGASSSADLKSGGGDSVFVRMITKGMSKSLDSYPLSGQMQILYDLDLVERVGYVYSVDKYGTKDPLDYQYRDNVTNMVKTIEKNPYNFTSNEICVHHRIGPEFIKGIRVNNNLQKNNLIQALKKEGFVTQNSLNQDCINGIPLDQFIRVGDVKPEYWT